MTRCKSCNKKTAVVNLLVCKFCNNEHCISCNPIEKHNCDNAEKCKQDARILLSEYLMSSKCVNTGNLEKM